MYSKRGRPILTGFLFGLLLIGTYLAYAPGLQGPFVLDDTVSIPRTALQSLAWPEVRNHIFWDSHLFGLSRGLANLSFGLTQFASGLDPFAFKYQNTLLHLLNGALVFWLVSLLLGHGAQDKQRTNLLALAIAAVWLLHPLQVSTVLYAVQRLVLLSSTFVLLALVSYVKGRIWGFRRPVAALVVTALGVLFFGGLGLLSKESAALLPLYLAAVELFFFRLTAASPTQKRLLFTFLGIFVALPIAAGLLYGMTHVESLIGGYQARDFTLVERLMTEVHALALYLKLFFLPLPAGMSLFHDNFPVQRELDLATTLLALGYLALIVAALLLRRTPLAAAGFGILWFFLCHSLESTFVSLELVFEHRNYLAILGLSIALIVGASRLFDTPKLKRIAPLLTIALVALLGANTAARSFVWGSGELLLRTQYQQRPDSPRVLDGLYTLELQRGNIEEARLYLLEARELDPGAPHLFINELRTFCTAHTYPTGLAEEAIQGIEQNARSAGLFSALNSLVSSHLAGRCPALGYQIVYDLVTAFAISDSIPSNKERFLALILQGRLLISQERWQDAEAVYARALDLARVKPRAYANLAVNELVPPLLASGQIDILGRLLSKVAHPEQYQSR